LGDTVEVTEKHYGHLVLDHSDIGAGTSPPQSGQPWTLIRSMASSRSWTSNWTSR
jgi:hypothetical protein